MESTLSMKSHVQEQTVSFTSKRGLSSTIQYYTRRKLFGKIRTKYGDQTLNQINQKFGKLLRTDIQFSDKII